MSLNVVRVDLRIERQKDSPWQYVFGKRQPLASLSPYHELHAQMTRAGSIPKMEPGFLRTRMLCPQGASVALSVWHPLPSLPRTLWFLGWAPSDATELGPAEGMHQAQQHPPAPDPGPSCHLTDNPLSKNPVTLVKSLSQNSFPSW